MSTISEFWKTVSEPREARQKIEGKKRQQEWKDAIRAHASVVLVASEALQEPMRLIERLISPEIRCLNITAAPQQKDILEGAIKGAFMEWGRYLLLGLGPKAEDDSSADSLERFAFDEAKKNGSSHAIYFASIADMLTYEWPRSPFDAAKMVASAGLVIVDECRPHKHVVDEMLGLLMPSFPRSDLIFMTPKKDPIVSHARELFEAAATL